MIAKYKTFLSMELLNLDRFTLDVTKYDILPDVIGHGQYGRVLKAERKSDKKMFAFKYLHESLTTPTSQKNFMREIQTLAVVSHPCILDLSGFSIPFFHVPGAKTIISTPFMENGSLQEMLKLETNGLAADYWTDTTKTICAFGIAAGLQYLHSLGLVHRDIKPENIMLDENYHPVIADFGFAKAIDPSLENTRRVGTPAFSAPEIFVSTNYSYPVDVYSFGVLLYSFFEPSYCCPPKGTKHWFTVQKILEGSRPPLTDAIPDVWKNLIKSCWSHDYTSRPTFTDIIDMMLPDDTELLFPGCDINEFLDYKEDILMVYDPNKHRNPK